jgi:predicted nucleic acid-binding protein
MLFLDTSALLKRYVEEAGTELVLELMAEDLDWAASNLAQAEAEVTLCRARLGQKAEAAQRQRLRADWERFVVVPVDGPCLLRAAEIGCLHRVRTLDALHLAAADRLPKPLVFMTVDRRQAAAAKAIGLQVPGEVVPEH